MSKVTIIDIENIEQEFDRTLESRVVTLEQQVKTLLETQKRSLQNFREMIAAVTEISTE